MATTTLLLFLLTTDGKHKIYKREQEKYAPLVSPTLHRVQEKNIICLLWGENIYHTFCGKFIQSTMYSIFYQHRPSFVEDTTKAFWHTFFLGHRVE